MKLSEDQLHQLEKLQMAGAYIQAYRSLVSWGDWRSFENAESRIIAGRILCNVGAERSGRRLFIQAYRDEPNHPTAIYHFCRTIVNRRGPWPALQFFQSQTQMMDAPVAVRADWLAAYGSTLAIFRDFDRAMDLVDQAIALSPSDPWMYVEKAYVFQQQDKYDQALATTIHAETLMPMYRPVIQHKAYLLTITGRDQEALELLSKASTALESYAVLTQLIYLQQELGLYEQARENLKRVPDLCPIMERRTQEWFAAVRADAEYYCGNHQAAIETGRSLPAKHPSRPILDRMEKNLGAGKRVRLEVPFTRQHHVTCVPATLATLSRFLGKPADHLKIAETICYDGTPPSAERMWAIENGFKAREFTLTWDSATALIDRGLPFMFFTVDPGNGHAQAIIGYDSFRGTLLVRDPYYRNVVEFDAEATLKKYRSSGPRAMVIVPEERAEELAHFQLPDAEYYDELFTVQNALEKYRREEAAAAVQKLETAAPQHRITVYAQRAVAIYDTNRPATLAATETLLKDYPDDGNLLLSKLYSLNDLGTRQERLALLQQAWKRYSSPIFATHIVDELSSDARQLPMMRHMIRQAIRSAPTSSHSYRSLGSIYWMRREFSEACGIYRLAATLDDKNESHAWAYFQATLPVKRTAEGLQFLERRVERLSQLSTAPIRTLIDAYDSLDQHPRAFELLEKALKEHADDPDLLLFAARRYTAYNQHERGQELLTRAKDKAYPLGWLYAAAEMASYRADHESALSLWRQVAERDQLNMNAHRSVARLLANTQSPKAAQDYLRELREHFPHHGEIMETEILWLRDEPPAEVEPFIRQLLEKAPQNAWAHRELALCLSRQLRHEEALESARASEALEPASMATLNTLISVANARGDKAEHRAICRHAIEISADNEFAIKAMLKSSENEAEKREALDLIQRELARQVIMGDGLLAYRSAAEAVLPGAEVLDRLAEAHRIRPDLWQSWVALAQQQIYCNQPAESLKTMIAASERFPLLPVIWIERSRIEWNLNQRQAQIESIQQALRINPSWSYASRELAEAYQGIDNLDAARDALHSAISRSPLDAANYVFLADVLSRQNQIEQAIVQVEKAIRIDPEVEDWWQRLKGYCDKAGKPELALQKARDLARRNAGDANAWMILAGLLTEFQYLDEAIHAANRVLELRPHSVDARDQLGYMLAMHHRYDEALAACGEKQENAHLHIRLQSRIAWIYAHMGQLDRAIDMMKSILQQDQSNYTGWRWLAGWQSDKKLWDDYLETSTKMAALWPAWTDALEHLAHAQWMTQKNQDARATLTRILELDPSSTYAPAALSELQIEAGEFSSALTTLEYFKKQNNVPEYLKRKIWIELKEKKTAEAAETFGELCAISHAPLNTLDREFKRCIDEKVPEEAIGLKLKAALAANGAPHCAALLVRIECNHNHWQRAWETVKSLADRREHLLIAIREVLDKACEFHQTWLIAEIHKHFGQQIQTDVPAWAQLGYAYFQVKNYRRVIDVLKNYSNHPKYPASALLNLAMSYRALGKLDDAERVHRDALKQEPDYSYSYHLMWLGEIQFMRGDYANGLALCDKAIPEELSKFYITMKKRMQLGYDLCQQKEKFGFLNTWRRIEDTRAIAKKSESDMAIIVNRSIRKQILKRGRWYARVMILWDMITHF